jgi:predicted nucleotide-binding protein
MARIDQDLLDKLKARLGLSQSRIYAHIDTTGRSLHLPRHLAALALAAQRGINIHRYASPQDWADLRAAGGAARGAQAPQSPAPVAVASGGKVARKAKKKAKRGPRNTVFVVHGRDTRLRDSMFEFLRAIGLKPLEWNQVIKLTRQASPYVGTILDTAFREAAAVVVLLTPDDEAQLKREFWSSRDGRDEKALTGQARPNVLFEAGLAFGRNPTSTILVEVGKVRPFSDVAGRHVVHLANAPHSRQELAMKLENAGCDVDRSGVDWLTAGDFEGPTLRTGGPRKREG